LHLQKIFAEPDDLPDPRALPVVKWAGGKRSIIPDLLRFVPRGYNNYYEPFLGGAAFFLALTPRPSHAVLADANGDLIDMYRAVRDEPDAVMEALERRDPYVQDADYFYRERRVQPSTLTLPERAARFIYLNKTCYNGLYRVNKAGQFNVPFGRYTTKPMLYQRANIERVSKLLKGADLHCDDFETVLTDVQCGDFVYVDPPYVPLTETANFTKYTSGSFGSADQRRLADAVRRLHDRGCKILISNSDTPLVRELYAGFEMHTVYAPRQINSDVTGRKRIAELVIRTYPVD
jgi:DNA adenine methylase